MTRAYHCTKPHSSKRTGYDNIREMIAGPLTNTPSMIHLSHQLEIVPLRRVSQPPPLTMPHSLGGSNRFEKFLEPVFAKRSKKYSKRREGPPQLAAGKRKSTPIRLNISSWPSRWRLRLPVSAWPGSLPRCRQGLRGADCRSKPRGLYHVLLNKYYVDEAYDYAFTGRRKVKGVGLGVLGLGEASSWFDSHVIDGIVQRGRLAHPPQRNDFKLVGQVDH